MGLFGLGKKDPAAEGDRWYEKSLRSGDRELEYLHKSVSLGSKKGMMGLARFYLKYAADDAEKMQQAASLMERAEAAGAPPDDVTRGHISWAGRRMPRRAAAGARSRGTAGASSKPAKTTTPAAFLKRTRTRPGPSMRRRRSRTWPGPSAPWGPFIGRAGA